MSIKRQRGLTLMELVLFMVIMGVAAASVIGVLNYSTRTSADPLRRKQALMIAEAFMEEVQMARFTYCEPTDPNAASATSQGACATPVVISDKSANVPPPTRPYGNVAYYASAEGVAQRSFAVNGVDLDINGRPLGQDASLNKIGNASLSGITTTVTLSYVPPGSGLGPGAQAITSSAGAMNVLKITIKTTYGTGANEYVQLDGYRTRYAPNYLP